MVEHFNWWKVLWGRAMAANESVLIDLLRKACDEISRSVGSRFKGRFSLVVGRGAKLTSIVMSTSSSLLMVWWELNFGLRSTKSSQKILREM